MKVKNTLKTLALGSFLIAILTTGAIAQGTDDTTGTRTGTTESDRDRSSNWGWLGLLGLTGLAGLKGLKRTENRDRSTYAGGTTTART